MINFITFNINSFQTLFFEIVEREMRFMINIYNNIGVVRRYLPLKLSK